jgi:hypothetical protein
MVDPTKPETWKDTAGTTWSGGREVVTPQVMSSAWPPDFDWIHQGEPMDIAMQLLKMPMYETGIPGIRFTTQSEDEADWEKDPTFFGSGAPADAPEDNTLIDFIDRMTPNEFLSLLPRIG